MNLVYAVERLLDTGWNPGDGPMERLPDGRPYPSIDAVQEEFARAGLELSIKENPQFGCCRATWEPADDKAAEEEDHRGTVVGSCEREAAVYALAQLRETQAEKQLLPA